jgi:hypothetical protein
MPGKRSFDEQIAALDRLNDVSPEARVEPLRKALAHRNNFVVSKAADWFENLSLPSWLPSC